MNAKGCVTGKWNCLGCICMVSINMLNNMVAFPALSWNGRMDGAGWLGDLGRWGLVRRGNETDDRGASGEGRERLSTHRGTRHGNSSLLVKVRDDEGAVYVGLLLEGPKLAIQVQYERCAEMSRSNITHAARLTLFPAHSGLESRAHTNPTSLSSLHGGMLRICPEFYGFSRVVRERGYSFGSRSRVLRSVPRQGTFVLRQCGNARYSRYGNLRNETETKGDLA